MSRRVAIQMDPLESINPRTDSTLLLGLEAQRRGHTLFYYTPDRLSCRDGKVTARAHPVKFHADPSRYYALGKEILLDLSTMDVVLLRQDPPFNMAYIGTTYLLEKLIPKTLVVNHPAHVRNQPEKLFPILFRKFAPPTLVTADAGEISRFRKEHKDIIIKPLYGHGGYSVFRIKKDDQNFDALLEMIFVGQKDLWVVQPFLPEVKTGERRIIMVDGKLAGHVGRLPADGEIRANLRVGGKAAKVALTKKQRAVCEAIGPELKKRGLIFAGVDMIGDHLIEINITCPTTLVAINGLYNVKLERDIWEAIEQYA